MKSRKEYSNFLKSLLRCNLKQRRSRLNQCRVADVRFLSECCLNLLRGNIPVNEKQKKTLSRYKNVIRKLSIPRRTTTFRKRVFTQTGNGFWLALLPAAISALTSLIRWALSKRWRSWAAQTEAVKRNWRTKLTKSLINARIRRSVSSYIIRR